MGKKQVTPTSRSRRETKDCLANQNFSEFRGLKSTIRGRRVRDKNIRVWMPRRILWLQRDRMLASQWRMESFEDKIRMALLTSPLASFLQTSLALTWEWELRVALRRKGSIGAKGLDKKRFMLFITQSVNEERRLPLLRGFLIQMEANRRSFCQLLLESELHVLESMEQRADIWRHIFLISRHPSEYDSKSVP